MSGIIQKKTTPSGIASPAAGSVFMGIDDSGVFYTKNESGEIITYSSASGSTQPFAASVEAWRDAGSVWQPLGISDITLSLSKDPATFNVRCFISLNRGTQWGTVSVNAVTSGAGGWSLPISSITIEGNQTQGELAATFNQNVEGESVLVITITDGTYSITRKITVIVSGSGYYGGTGLGAILI